MKTELYKTVLSESKGMLRRETGCNFGKTPRVGLMLQLFFEIGCMNHHFTSQL
jgi:hypothetical protein